MADFTESLADIIKDYTESIIKLADEHGLDRDDEMLKAAVIIMEMCTEGTFRYYEFKEAPKC